MFDNELFELTEEFVARDTRPPPPLKAASYRLRLSPCFFVNLRCAHDKYNDIDSHLHVKQFRYPSFPYPRADGSESGMPTKLCSIRGRATKIGWHGPRRGRTSQRASGQWARNWGTSPRSMIPRCPRSSSGYLSSGYPRDPSQGAGTQREDERQAASTRGRR
jgi:hypothetical protein